MIMEPWRDGSVAVLEGSEPVPIPVIPRLTSVGATQLPPCKPQQLDPKLRRLDWHTIVFTTAFASKGPKQPIIHQPAKPYFAKSREIPVGVRMKSRKRDTYLEASTENVAVSRLRSRGSLALWRCGVRTYVRAAPPDGRVLGGCHPQHGPPRHPPRSAAKQIRD